MEEGGRGRKAEIEPFEAASSGQETQTRQKRFARKPNCPPDTTAGTTKDEEEARQESAFRGKVSSSQGLRLGKNRPAWRPNFPPDTTYGTPTGHDERDNTTYGTPHLSMRPMSPEDFFATFNESSSTKGFPRLL
jgi:hypothetical protein